MGYICTTRWHWASRRTGRRPLNVAGGLRQRPHACGPTLSLRAVAFSPRQPVRPRQTDSESQTPWLPSDITPLLVCCCQTLRYQCDLFSKPQLAYTPIKNLLQYDEEQTALLTFTVNQLANMVDNCFKENRATFNMGVKLFQLCWTLCSNSQNFISDCGDSSPVRLKEET